MANGARSNTIRSNLPPEISSFVGRRGDVAELRQQLTAARLVTVTGIGGVGKTRIALRVAGTTARLFPDGRWLVSLSELDGSTPVAEVVSQVLGVRDQSARRPADLLADLLRDKRLLLVLDDCERQRKECAELVDLLLRAAPSLRVLATSRLPLHVAGETVHPMAPLPVSAPGETVSEATELFRERAATVPGVQLTDADLPAIADLCRRLDGIPLAIELAAGCLSALSVAQIAERLDHRFRLLAANRLAVPRHRTLSAAIDGSYELCRPEQRLLWARLSVFAGEFDLAAVEAICPADDLPVPDLPHHLRALVEHCVVTRVAGGAVPRFRLLDTIREYGAQRLDELGGGQQCRHRYRDYYATLAAEAERAWTGPGQLRWFEPMRGERNNLRAALDAYLDDPVAAFAAGVQGDLDRADELAEQCLAEAIAADDQELHACALETLGLLAAIRGDLDVAIDRLTAAIARYDKVPGSEAGLLRTLGEAAYARNVRVGVELGVDQLVAYALDASPVETALEVIGAGPHLTPREAEIARLIAEGLSNREIADRLGIARRTAESHVENILAKLGFKARTQVAAWVVATQRPGTSFG